MAVLVVDDDATVVNLVTAVLHRAGIEAEVALDGPGALQRLARGRYRAVLSDLTMPGMSGLQLLREARARGHELPFLIMTAYLVPEAEASLRAEPGVAGVLRKPFDIKRLVDEVRGLLRAAGVEPKVAAPAVAVLAAAAPAAEAAGVAAAAAAAPAAEATAELVAERADDEVGLVVEARDDTLVVASVREAESVAELVADESESVSAGAAALLPLSLVEMVSARILRQALIARAERRAAALIARGPARPIVVEEREAAQGC